MRANSLTSVKFLNWVCSRVLAVALPTLPSGSEEFLKIRAMVAMAFSRSEPFFKAVQEEMKSGGSEEEYDALCRHRAVSSEGACRRSMQCICQCAQCPFLELNLGLSDPVSLNNRE